MQTEVFYRVCTNGVSVINYGFFFSFTNKGGTGVVLIFYMLNFACYIVLAFLIINCFDKNKQINEFKKRNLVADHKCWTFV